MSPEQASAATAAAAAAAAAARKLTDEKVVWGSYLRARKVKDSRMPHLKSSKTVESKGFFYLRGHQFWRRLSRMESLMSGRTLRGAELIFSINNIDRVEMSFTPARATHAEVLVSLTGEQPSYQRRESNMSTETSHAWDENASDWTSDAVTVGGNEDALLHALEEGSMSPVDGKMLVFLSMKAPTPGQIVEFRSNSARELICLRDELNHLCNLKARQSTSSSCSFTSFSTNTGSLVKRKSTGFRRLSGASPLTHSGRKSSVPIAPPRIRGAGSHVENGKLAFRKSKQRKPTRSPQTSKQGTLSEHKLSL